MIFSFLIVLCTMLIFAELGQMLKVRYFFCSVLVGLLLIGAANASLAVLNPQLIRPLSMALVFFLLVRIALYRRKALFRYWKGLKVWGSEQQLLTGVVGLAAIYFFPFNMYFDLSSASPALPYNWHYHYYSEQSTEMLLADYSHRLMERDKAPRLYHKYQFFTPGVVAAIRAWVPANLMNYLHAKSALLVLCVGVFAELSLRFQMTMTTRRRSYETHIGWTLAFATAMFFLLSFAGDYISSNSVGNGVLMFPGLVMVFYSFLRKRPWLAFCGVSVVALCDARTIFFGVMLGLVWFVWFLLRFNLLRFLKTHAVALVLIFSLSVACLLTFILTGKVFDENSTHANWFYLWDPVGGWAHLLFAFKWIGLLDLNWDLKLSGLRWWNAYDNLRTEAHWLFHAASVALAALVSLRLIQWWKEKKFLVLLCSNFLWLLVVFNLTNEWWPIWAHLMTFYLVAPLALASFGFRLTTQSVVWYYVNLTSLAAVVYVVPYQGAVKGPLLAFLDIAIVILIGFHSSQLFERLPQFRGLPAVPRLRFAVGPLLLIGVFAGFGFNLSADYFAKMDHSKGTYLFSLQASPAQLLLHTPWSLPWESSEELDQYKNFPKKFKLSMQGKAVE